MGNFPASAEENERSSKIALEGGDELRGWIGKFTGGIARYLGNMLSPEEYMEVMKLREMEFDQLGSIDADDSGLHNSFRFSLTYAKANLLYDLDDQEYLNSVEEVLADEHFRSRLARDVPAFVWIDLRLRAREKAMTGDLESAVKIFERFVEASGNTPNGERRIIDHVRGWPVEYARDYRDYGKTLSALGGERNSRLARDVWTAALDKTFGIDQPEYDWGNYRYRVEIEALLQD